MKMLLLGLVMSGLFALTSCGPLTKIEDSTPIKLIVKTASGNIHISRGRDDKVSISSRFIVRGPAAWGLVKMIIDLFNKSPLT